ncbi:MAG: flavin-containing monooxygenase [Ilumatobacter sp.]|uniref:flavin-containing monooxygenase n=1 Tax=Ilumatobacter sp. TaxID=1967498 RepID=UPI00391DABC9
MNATQLDPDQIDRALEDADIPILLMVLVHLTGDMRWIAEPYRPLRDVRLFPDESGGLSPEIRREVRSAAAAELHKLVEGATVFEPSTDEYASMMSACVGEAVPPEYVGLFLEEMGFVPSTPDKTLDGDPPPGPPRDVLIIGAGFSGLAAAIRLQASGFEFTIVERNSSVGGVWVDNTYPDAGVDTPNHFYSFSFRPNLAWSSYFSKQPEVLSYIADCAEHYGILERIEFDTEVLETRWVESDQQWDTTLRRSDGRHDRIRSDVVIAATGHLSQPQIPDIEGLDDFTGPVFHTSQWRHEVDLSSKRVAMVGVGASAIQAARTVAAEADHFAVFQRSPQWVAPNPDYHRNVSDEKLWLLANVPRYANWYRFVRFWRYGDSLLQSLFKVDGWDHADRSVSPANDRHRRFFTEYLLSELEGRDDLIAKTLPTYPPFGKRMLVDNDWFKTLRLDHVELVTDPIERITRTGIVTEDGTEFAVDVIILATGFYARRYVWPVEAIGRRNLREIWDEDDARAYLGLTIPDMPNFFVMGGPNTSLAHGGSAIFHAECQARYIVSLLDQLRSNGYAVGDVDPGVLESYIAKVDERHQDLVWTHPGMSNWYRNADGRVVATTPWRMVDYWAMTHEAALGDYRLDRPSSAGSDEVATAQDDSVARASERR